MLGNAARLLAVIVLAVGLVCLPSTPPTADAAPKKAAKKESKKKDAKKSDSKKDKRAAAKSKKDAKKDKKSAKRSDSKKDKRTASKSKSKSKKDRDDDARASRSRRVRDSRPAPKREPVAALDDDGEREETREARPANRYVGDIPHARVVEIQSALIREGLLAGPASGVYDQATFSAMANFQERKGFKPVGVPTAHSLKELGVRKNSGYGTHTPARVVETTAPER